MHAINIGYSDRATSTYINSKINVIACMDLIAFLDHPISWAHSMASQVTITGSSWRVAIASCMLIGLQLILSQSPSPSCFYPKNPSLCPRPRPAFTPSRNYVSLLSIMAS